MAQIINSTNITSETKAMVYVKEHKNLIIQNEITCGASDSLSIKYYGTIFKDAEIDSDNYWVDITDMLFTRDSVDCENETVRTMGVIDTQISLVKIKVVVTVNTAEPSNRVEVYYDC